MALLADHLGPEGVLLLIDASSRQCFAKFYSSRQGRLHPSSAILLAASPRLGVPDAPSSTTGIKTLPGASAAQSPQPGAPTHRYGGAQVGLILIAIAIMALGAIQYRTLKMVGDQRTEAASASGALDLRTERSGDSQWRISWNRSAAAVKKAGKAQLLILDGFLRKEITLTPDDLRNGGIVYSPIADDVSFRLEVFDVQAGRAVSESIRVLANPWPESPGGALDAKAGAGAAAPGTRLIATRPQPSTSDSEASRRLGPPGERQSHTPLEASDALRQQPRFTAPHIANPVVVSRKVDDLPLPPALEWNSQLLPAYAGAEPAVKPPDAPTPSPARPPQAVTTSAGEKHTERGVERPTYSGVESAVLLHKVDPLYPKVAADMHLMGTVRVEATVGTDGRLAGPRIVNGSPLLNSAVLQALREWRYKPARLNGKVVASPVTLEIRFAPR
jgi:protein TonB